MIYLIHMIPLINLFFKNHGDRSIAWSRSIHHWRIVVLLIIVQTIFLSSFSQTPFKAGVTGGGAFTQVDGDGYSGWNKVGTAIGGFVYNNFGWKKTSLQMELQYINKGSRKPPKQNNGFTYYKIVLNYVEVPLLVKYRHKKFNFETGLSYAQLIRQREFDLSGELIPREYQGGNFKKYDVLFNAGAGYFFTEKFSLNVRYSYSVLPVRNYVVINDPRFGFFGINSIGFFGGTYNAALVYSLRYQFGETQKKEEPPKEEKPKKSLMEEILKIE